MKISKSFPKKAKSFDAFINLIGEGYSINIKPFLNTSYGGGYTALGRIGAENYGINFTAGKDGKRPVKLCEIYDSNPTAEFSLAEKLDTKSQSIKGAQLLLTAEEKAKTLLSKLPNLKINILTRKSILTEEEKNQMLEIVQQYKLSPFKDKKEINKKRGNTKKHLLDFVFGSTETADNYGGAFPGLVALLGPAAIPIYLARGYIQEWKKSKLEKSVVNSQNTN